MWQVAKRKPKQEDEVFFFFLAFLQFLGFCGDKGCGGGGGEEEDFPGEEEVCNKETKHRRGDDGV